MKEESSPYFVDCSVHWAVKYFLCDLWGNSIDIDSMSRKDLFELYIEITVSDIYYQYKIINTFHESQEDNATLAQMLFSLKDPVINKEVISWFIPAASEGVVAAMGEGAVGDDVADDF